MALVAQDHTQDFPDAGYGAQEGQDLRTVLRGSGHEVSRQIAEELVVVAKQGEVHFDALVHGGLGTPLGHAVAGGLRGKFFPNRGPVVLTVGVLDVGQERGPFPREAQAAPEQIPGGAPLGRRHLGLGEHPATQEHRHLVRIDRVVLGLAAMDRLHREGMAEDKRDAFLGTEVGQPGPGEQAFDGDDERIARGRNGLEERVWVGLQMAVQDDLPLLVQDADVHGPSVHVNATVTLVRRGVASPEVSSSS